MQSNSESLDTFLSSLSSCSSISAAAGRLRFRVCALLSAVTFSASLAISSTSCILNTNFPFNATRLLVIRRFRFLRSSLYL
ncbi:hypothetical protein M433DRAFT_160353, partial [Acidomyces richmondensis BFW]